MFYFAKNKDKMNILISCLSRSWGGMEMFAVNTARWLSSSNYNVFFLALKDSPIEKALNFVLKENILLLKKSSYFNLSYIIKVRKFIVRNNIDLIHTQYSKDLWTISPALLLINKPIPLVFTKQLGSFVIKKDLLHKLIYKRVDAAIAISSIIKKNLLETTTIPKEKIHLIHNAIDLEKFNPQLFNKLTIRKNLNIEEDKIVFTHISRLSPGKGQDIVLKALNEIKEKIQDSIFLFVGSAQSDEKDYELNLLKLVDEFNLNSIVRFLGFRTDIPEILSITDVFLFPSLGEAFGISLVEAMAMGIPSIVCRADGVLDILIENETSLTFERNDYKSLANLILKMSNDKNLRESLGKKSLNRAQEFSSKNYIQKVSALYLKLIKNKFN